MRKMVRVQLHPICFRFGLIRSLYVAERSGLKLGLGDFVFYSVLIARAGEIAQVFSCFIASLAVNMRK